jgi:murein DD-endopeptidase MepM/ murein hydrolase activator NlpD
LESFSVTDRRGHFLFRKPLLTVLICAVAAMPLVSHAAANQATQGVILPPVASACVSSPFGPRIIPNRPLAGTFHNGIDLPAPAGAAVTAVAPGSVIRVQRHGVGGLEILIQHDGFIGVYSHLGLLSPLIAEGRKAVYGGERIARVGRSGLTYGSHLYFGMIKDGHAVDPSPYLGIGPCDMPAKAKPDAKPRPTHLLSEPQP